MCKKMIIKTVSVFHKEVKIVYNLLFTEAFYSLECYIEGKDKEEIVNYSIAKNITDDEGEAEFFFKYMIKGKVLPIHIKDVAQDYFRV